MTPAFCAWCGYEFGADEEPCIVSEERGRAWCSMKCYTADVQIEDVCRLFPIEEWSQS